MSFGRPYILKIDGCIHDGWLVLRDNKEVFDKRFLYYYLSSRPTYEKFKSMAVGGVVNNLNSEMVRKVDVPIPNREEQVEIADILDRVNGVIAKRNKELFALDELTKARFLILDYCGNFEYFDLHPDGRDGKERMTLSQRLFQIRLDMLYELQRLEFQQNVRMKAYYDAIKTHLHNSVIKIKSHNNRIQIREAMQYVDKYYDLETWVSLSPVMVKEAKVHLSPLLDSGLNGDFLAISFDGSGYKREQKVFCPVCRHKVRRYCCCDFHKEQYNEHDRCGNLKEFQRISNKTDTGE